MRAGVTGIELVRIHGWVYIQHKGLAEFSASPFFIGPTAPNAFMVGIRFLAKCVNVSMLVRNGNFEYSQGEIL